MPQLKLKNISFAYDKRLVLSDISLSINHGEIVGILGPNGAGKSTLIKLIAGLIKPRSGDILLDDRPLRSFSGRELARTIALVPQESAIPFSFKAFEVVLMGRQPHLTTFGFESKNDLAVSMDAMKKTDCFELAPRSINELSGGEKQRVILARAFAQTPKLLLLDEPTTFLDIKHQLTLCKLLKKENEDSGLTIVCAMHDLNLAGAFCDRVVILKGGSIAADGKSAEVMRKEIVGPAFDITQAELTAILLKPDE